MMNANLIILSNTYPFGGEPFLHAELEMIPSKTKITICPFFGFVANEKKYSDVRPYVGKNSIVTKLKAGCRSLVYFFSRNEIRVALSKKNRIRNILKAVKFAYTSELRIYSIQTWIQNEEFDQRGLIFYAYWMYEVAYVGARLKEIFPKSRFVARCHGYDLYEERHPNGYIPYRHYILGSADKIFPISDNGKRYLHERYKGKYDSKISVARLGTSRDFDIYDGNDSDATVIVSCSSLIPLKRVHLIIEALAKYETMIEWFHFGDGDLRNELEKRARSLPPNVKATFLGHVQNIEIQAFYSTHMITAFINVSEIEGVPVSIMEAQSYGIPVIATNVGGTSEIVMNKINGVLLKKNFKVSDFLNALEFVKNNRVILGSNAIKTWEKMSNSKTTTQRFYSYLEELEEQ